jgi:hypothetical protein
MWRHVDLVWTDGSEERIASIFRVEKSAGEERATCSRLFSLAHFSTLKTEAIRSTETSVYARSIRRHIPEDGILHSQRCENLKSCKNNETEGNTHISVEALRDWTTVLFRA